jgi:translation initiation factor 2 subunit 2
MDDYETLLDSAKAQLPQDEETANRFEIPKVKGHIEGNKTIVSNFIAIAQVLGRKPEHFLKYILKELATPGEIYKQAAIFKAKVPASKINDKIKEYSELFVICKECQKPDTKISKEGNVYFVKCQACGARYSVYSKT